MALLLGGNALFHIEAARGDGTTFGTQMGVAATVVLIMLIGGRIVPSFTRNWLAKRGSGGLPEPFNRFDVFAMAGSGAALAA